MGRQLTPGEQIRQEEAERRKIAEKKRREREQAERERKRREAERRYEQDTRLNRQMNSYNDEYQGD